MFNAQEGKKMTTPVGAIKATPHEMCPFCDEYRKPDAWIALEQDAARLRTALQQLVDAEEEYGDQDNAAINEKWLAAKAVLAL